ncbi:hypothetical protein ACFFSY_08055 [Paenibacillus aurantiacus]|uniref:Uncharacterized protein n=1 Tax=Paenibacillus aurantiacus TaxID=1936118 RepID=A0ABV5KL37_9BACL
MSIAIKRRRTRFVMLVIPVSMLKQMMVYDFIGGTACYWLMKQGHWSEVAAFIGSSFAPAVLKRAVSAGTGLARVKTLPSPWQEPPAAGAGMGGRPAVRGGVRVVRLRGRK